MTIFPLQYRSLSHAADLSHFGAVKDALEGSKGHQFIQECVLTGTGPNTCSDEDGGVTNVRVRVHLEQTGVRYLRTSYVLLSM